MENQNFKKSMFGGFDRDEVLDYVDKITIDHKNKIDDLQVQIKKDSAQKIQLKEDLEQVRRDLEIERKENERVKQLNIDLGKRIKTIISENEALKETTKNITSDLQERLKRAEEELKEKSERLLSYTRLGIDAEKVMKEAEERARSVTSKANNQSAQLLLKANEEAKEIVQKAQKESQKVKDEMKFIEATLLKLKAKANKDAELIISEAKERANKIDAVTKERLTKINAEINKHNEQVGQIKRSLLTLTRQAAISIDQIPENAFTHIKFEHLSTPIQQVQQQENQKSQFQQTSEQDQNQKK